MPAAPPRRTQAERRAQTRAKLLKAAGAVFARRGYHEATLEEIAERAGLSKGALYYNFASKEDLFLALLKTRDYDALVLDVRDEYRSAILESLHPYVRERLAGEIDVDLSSATADAVRRAAGKVLAEVHERKVREALERLREGLGRGVRAAAGLSDVVAALNERRVELLLYEQGRAQTGVVCPNDGWLGVGEDECPIDGTPVERRENILENADEAAILQDAEVLVIDPFEHPDLGPHGGIGAVLRF